MRPAMPSEINLNTQLGQALGLLVVATVATMIVVVMMIVMVVVTMRGLRLRNKRRRASLRSVTKNRGRCAWGNSNPAIAVRHRLTRVEITRRDKIEIFAFGIPARRMVDAQRRQLIVDLARLNHQQRE